LVKLNNNFTIDLKNLKEADESKIATIESNEKWHNENKDTISIYDRYLNLDNLVRVTIIIIKN